MIVLPASFTRLIPSDMANLRYNIVYLPHVDRRMPSFCWSYPQVSWLLWRKDLTIEVFRSQIADESREEGILEEKFKKIFEMNKVVKRIETTPIFQFVSYPSICLFDQFQFCLLHFPSLIRFSRSLLWSPLDSHNHFSTFIYSSLLRSLEKKRKVRIT